jgi:L-2-hydroxyglutarate oxidase LhgO
VLVVYGRPANGVTEKGSLLLMILSQGFGPGGPQCHQFHGPNMQFRSRNYCTRSGLQMFEGSLFINHRVAGTRLSDPGFDGPFRLRMKGQVLLRELDVGGADPMTLRCRLLVNAAGLHAPGLARKFIGMPQDRVPTAYYAKGNYFTLAGRSPFSRLIYPVPVPGGLGVHLTIDLGGQARFGPDVEWIDSIEYTVDPTRADSFYAAVRKYWPDLKDGALQPGYAGVRPKIVPKGAPGQDFVVQGPQTHGVAGLINLFGIESPGLTASMAIADHVLEVSQTG